MLILSHERKKPIPLQRITRSGVMLAAALVLALLEGILPPLPAPIPLRYGLANIAIMATIIFIGPMEAFAVAFLKSVFVLMTRGLIAGLVSMTGTLLSVGVMIALDYLFKRRTSVFLMSTMGAIFHNAGQLLFLMLFMQFKISVVFVGPYLLLFGLLTGLLSGLLLFVTMRPLRAFFKLNEKKCIP